MFKKIIMIIVLSWLIFFPGIVLAVDASSKIPELNPMCWKEEDCKKQREAFGTADKKSGWLKGEEPCNKAEWGKCLPAGTTKTEISFGGKSEFANVGEFIILMYKYLVTIASIVAVVMIIIAGMQWVTSGGNSETISSAKKRISGALVGLFIAYMSYFILNTINPALVNLRLPQVFLIRPIAMMPEFCSDIEGAKDGEIKFLWAADKDHQKDLVTPDKTQTGEKEYKWDPKNNKEMFNCGSRFFAENGGQTSCLGDTCQKLPNGGNPLCMDLENKYQCENAIMGGKITYNRILGEVGCVAGSVIPGSEGEGWEKPDITDSDNDGVFSDDDTPELYAVCENNSTKARRFIEITDNKDSSTATKGDHQVYGISRERLSTATLETRYYECDPEKEKVVGLALKVWMNEDCDSTDEVHMIGNGGVDLGESFHEISSCSSQDNWLNHNLHLINPKYFIPNAQDVLSNGLHFNIDAARINDIDGCLKASAGFYEYLKQ